LSCLHASRIVRRRLESRMSIMSLFFILLYILRLLKVLVTRAADNDIVYLENHAAELRGEHELLLLSD
jgi:hypothetical protein